MIILGVIFAITSISDRKFRHTFVALTSIALGLLLMLFSASSLWSFEVSLSFVGTFASFTFGGLFILAGVISFISIPLSKRRKLARCTMQIQAKCIGFLNQRSFSNPIFSYSYEGSEYTTKANSYTNMDTAQIDSNYDIYINPNNPEEIYFPSSNHNFFTTIFGFIFVIIGVVFFYTLSDLFTFWSSL